MIEPKALVQVRVRGLMEVEEMGNGVRWVDDQLSVEKLTCQFEWANQVLRGSLVEWIVVEGW